MRPSIETMPERIVISKGSSGWLATSDDPEVFDLFGTYTMPTPFTLAMPGAAVVERLSELNPDAVVELVAS